MFFELLAGFCFYLLIRPNILLFGLINFNTSPVILYSDTLVFNSLPSFISSAILFTLLSLILFDSQVKLSFVNYFVLLISYMSEFSQLLFSKKATFDLWDIAFSTIGSYLMFFIHTRIKRLKY